MSTPASVRALVAGLVDDAALFPPGNAPMPTALRDHRRHRSAWYHDLLGAFCCPDQRLPELQSCLRSLTGPDPQPLPLAVIVTGGAGAIAPAITWALRDPSVGLAAVEVALRGEDDLAYNARRVTTVLDTALPDGTVAYLEAPRLSDSSRPDPGWLAALDVVAESGHRLKYRTGGLEPSAFPSETELATLISAALDRELPVKFTAGLHGAVRNTAADSGFEQHGFLNVALATLAALHGADARQLAAVLAQRDREAVSSQVRALSPAEAAAARTWFPSFGSCSIVEPVDDLAELGLLSAETVGA